MESAREIASAELVTQHSELYHYTDAAGLEGITSTNTIWGTHFAHLNDLAEMRALRKPMTDCLLPRVTRCLRSRFSSRNEWRAFQTKFKINREVGLFVDAIFDVAFKPGNPEPLGDSYITSFCTHPEDSYEAKNGLLSQWRAYGGAVERYCIVFDSRKLMQLLEGEWDRYHWVYLKLTKVVYDSEFIGIGELFPDLLNLYEDYFNDAVVNGLSRIDRKMIGEFLAAATKFKHRAFREENETRVVAIPYKQQMVDEGRSMGSADDGREVKIVHNRKATRGDVAYLTLFAAPKIRLPIKRVIVGPSQHQDGNFERARRILGGRCSVYRSETPFGG